jgi:transmembrane sensor
MMAPRPDDDSFGVAARWLARLHAAPLDAGDQAALKAWLCADARHAEALDAARAVWALSGELATSETLVAERRRALTLRLADPARDLVGDAANDDPAKVQKSSPMRWRMVAAVAGLAVLLVTAQPPPAQAFETARGQSLQAVLADGSIIALNTGSRVVVHYGWFVNTATIEHGEAEITPAAGLHRPLRISVNGAELRPQGSVAVRDHGDSSTVLAVAAPVELRAPGAAPIRLDVAQRGTLATGGAARVARADPAHVLAWRQGQVIFDHASLGAAAAEFERYGNARVTVDPAVRGLEVSGAYRTSDMRAFLDALPAIHPVRWRRTTAGDIRIEPARVPA